MEITTSYPSVTVLIAAYNEADILAEKIRNTYNLRYPADQLDILLVTDGSTDGSDELFRDWPLVRVTHEPVRGGKLAAVDRAMKKVSSEIVVLTDANCLLNTEALQRIVRHYQNPVVGAVAGEKAVISTANDAGQGEGLYWKYESWLKKLDSELHSVVGAAGELFSFRRNLFINLPKDTIIEDFVLSMHIASQGYRVIYEPGAIASEAPSANFYEEWKRKVRICAGGFQATSRFKHLLPPASFSVLSFQFVSHRVLRWALVPFLLPVIFALSVILAAQGDPIGLVLTASQLGAYALALPGVFMMKRRQLPKLVSIAFQFVMMNAAAYAGLYRYLKGKQSAVWEKAMRASTIQPQTKLSV